MDKRKIIEQLRAKADRTEFPEEAAAFRARADKLEAKYGPQTAPRNDPYVPPGFRPPNPRRGNVSPDPQKVAEDWRQWSTGGRPMGITNLDDILQKFQQANGSPMGTIIVNGQAMHVTGNSTNMTGTGATFGYVSFTVVDPEQ